MTIAAEVSAAPARTRRAKRPPRRAPEVDPIPYPIGIDPIWALVKNDPDIPLLADNIDRFGREEVMPYVLQWHQQQHLPDGVMDRLQDATGIFSWNYPQAVGGAELSAVAQAYCSIRLAYYSLGLSVEPAVNSALGGSAFLALASPEQLQHFGPLFATRQKQVCFALTEPGAGSSPRMMKGTCRKDGDNFLVKKNATFISAAGNSDYSVIFVLDPESEVKDGMSAFLMDHSLDGVEIPDPMDKSGLHVSGTYEVFADDVAIPADMLLGERGKAWDKAKLGLGGGRLGVSAQACGGFLLLLASTYRQVERAQLTRRGATVGDMQAVQFSLAQHTINCRQAMRLVYDAARALDHAMETGSIVDLLQAHAIIAEAKYYAPKVALDALRDLGRLWGGFGFMAESLLSLLRADLPIVEVYDGPAETMLHTLAPEYRRVFVG